MRTLLCRWTRCRRNQDDSRRTVFYRKSALHDFHRSEQTGNYVCPGNMTVRSTRMYNTKTGSCYFLQKKQPLSIGLKLWNLAGKYALDLQFKKIMCIALSILCIRITKWRNDHGWWGALGPARHRHCNKALASTPACLCHCKQWTFWSSTFAVKHQY